MMSALGQKQIFAVQKVMSALHPKADTCGAKGDVRFGPIADIINSHIAVLLSVRIIDLGGRWLVRYIRRIVPIGLLSQTQVGS